MDSVDSNQWGTNPYEGISWAEQMEEEDRKKGVSQTFTTTTTTQIEEKTTPQPHTNAPARPPAQSWRELFRRSPSIEEFPNKLKDAQAFFIPRENDFHLLVAFNNSQYSKGKTTKAFVKAQNIQRIDSNSYQINYLNPDLRKESTTVKFSDTIRLTKQLWENFTQNQKCRTFWNPRNKALQFYPAKRIEDFLLEKRPQPTQRPRTILRPISYAPPLESMPAATVRDTTPKSLLPESSTWGSQDTSRWR